MDNNQKNSSEPEEKKENMSFFARAKEIDRKEAEAERARQEKAAKEYSDRLKAERAQHEEKLKAERIELMKLRAGAEADETVLMEEAPPEKVYTKKEKIENFWYHYKWTVIISVCVISLTTFLIYDVVTKIDSDASVMMLAESPELSLYSQNVSDYLQTLSDDYNDDGHIQITAVYMNTNDSTGANYEMALANQVKLMAELQDSNMMLMLATKADIDALEYKEGLVDVRPIFPDDPNATDMGYLLDDTDFAARCGFEALPSGLMLCVRENMGPASGDEMIAQKENAIRLLSRVVEDLKKE